jgi:hypothetical protein
MSRISPEGVAALTCPVTSVAVPAAAAPTAAGATVGGGDTDQTGAAISKAQRVAAKESVRTTLFMDPYSSMAH